MESSLKEIDNSQLVHDDAEDGERNDVAKEENHCLEIRSTAESIIRDFIAENLLIEIPSSKETDEHATDWEEDIWWNPIEEVEDGHVEKANIVEYTERKWTDATQEDADDSFGEGSTLAGPVEFFRHVGSNHFMQGNHTGERCKDDQQIKCCWEDVAKDG